MPWVLNNLVTERGHILVMGYPRLFASSGEWESWRTRCWGTTDVDVKMLNRVSDRLNSTILAEVKQSDSSQKRIHFLPVAPAFRPGHELCGKSPWLNGLTSQRLFSASFHPNAQGYAEEAKLAADFVRALPWSVGNPVTTRNDYPTTQEPGDVSSDYLESFESYQLGRAPGGWAFRGTTELTPTVETAGGSNHVLSFPSVSRQYWDKWAFKAAQSLTSPFTVTTKMMFRDAVADGAGITIGWKDAMSDRIDIRTNVYWDNIEFHQTGNMEGGFIVDGSGSERGGLAIDSATAYWLRVRAVSLANGDGQVTVLWSTDGINFAEVLIARGPSLNPEALEGMVGVGTTGPNLPQVWFDDFRIND